METLDLKSPCSKLVFHLKESIVVSVEYFFKPKVGGADCHHLGSASLQDNQKM